MSRASSRSRSPLGVVLLVAALAPPVALAADSDGDRLTNTFESNTSGTNPSDPDTDGDTVDDGAEWLVLGTDPLVDETFACVSNAANFTVVAEHPQAYGVLAADVDGDGHLDVITTSHGDDHVSWYAGDGTGVFDSTENPIATSALGALFADAADVDGDTYVDVVVASFDDNMIGFYQSDPLDPGTFSARQIITNTAVGARMARFVDIDGDDDLDVITASETDGVIAWYENDSLAWTYHFVDTHAFAKSVFAADLDADDDPDIVEASAQDYTVTWYENDGVGGFTARDDITDEGIEPDTGPRVTYAEDLDGDDDLDVIVALQESDTIAWYENDLENPLSTQWEKHVLSDVAAGARFVIAPDLDLDGDYDVVGASFDDNTVQWFENLTVAPGGGTAGAFAEGRMIDHDAVGARALFAADLDEDGYLDLLAASQDGDDMTYYPGLFGDPDGDTLIDLVEECISGTDPTLADTDGGGVDDGTELSVVTDPRTGQDYDDTPLTVNIVGAPVIGLNTFEVHNATPSVTVDLIFGNTGSATTYQCSTGTVGISSASSRGSATADQYGVATISVTTTAAEAGKTKAFAGYESGRCRVSETDTVHFP